MMSLTIGGVFSLFALTAALLLDGRMLETRTALPYAQGWKRATVFNLSMIAVVAMKILFLRGAIPLVIGIVPIAIVFRGSRLARSEVVARSTRRRPAERAQPPVHTREISLPDALIVQSTATGRVGGTPKIAGHERSIEATAEAKRRHAILTRWAYLAAALIMWAGFFWLVAYMATKRIDECYDLLSGDEMRNCMRDAMTTRDIAKLTSIGGPAISMAIWLMITALKARKD